MNFRLLKLNRRQIDKLLTKKQLIKSIKVPERGWIREIRNALCMSNAQLAKRLKVTAPAVTSIEKSEQKGKISLETLKKAAAALNCKLVYAIVPETSLEKIYDEQALKVADNLFRKASHTMELEKQGVDDIENREQLSDLYNEIKYSMNKKIWDNEI